MSTKLKRRAWLKQSMLLTAGLTLGTTQLSRLSARELTNPFTGEVELPESAGFIKAQLNLNENPHGPSAKARKALMESVAKGNLYPMALANELKEMIAKAENVSTDHIFLGPGSSSILTMAGIAYGLENGTIVSAHPTFRTLLDTALRFDCEWEQVALTTDLQHDLDKMSDKVNDDTKLVYICNPNNPTGTLMDAQKLRGFCASTSAKVPVFVDEAYTEFLDDPKTNSMIDLVRDGKNVILAKTFSKIYGLAGLRIGYGIALPDTVKQIKKFGQRFLPVGTASLSAAIASYKDKEFEAYCQTKTAEAREFVSRFLKDKGIKCIPSHTNFVLFPLKMNPAQYLAEMRNAGVAVRSWSFAGKDWCRVSMGTIEDMGVFAKAFTQVMG